MGTHAEPQYPSFAEIPSRSPKKKLPSPHPRRASAPILRRNSISKKIVYLRRTLAEPQHPSFAEIPSPFTFAAPTPSLMISIHPTPKFHLQKKLLTFAAPTPSLSIHPSLEFPSPKSCFSCLRRAEKSQHQSLNMKFCIAHQVLNRSTSTFLHPPHVINRYKLHS